MIGMILLMLVYVIDGHAEVVFHEMRSPTLCQRVVTAIEAMDESVATAKCYTVVRTNNRIDVVPLEE